MRPLLTATGSVALSVVCAVSLVSLMLVVHTDGSAAPHRDATLAQPDPSGSSRWQSPPGERGARIAPPQTPCQLEAEGRNACVVPNSSGPAAGPFSPSWTQVNESGPNSTPPWGVGSMTYDGYDHYLIAYGGCTDPSCDNLSRATWGFSGGSWHNLTTPGEAAPSCPLSYPPWEAGSLTYDPLEKFVLYNGCGTTWTFRAGVWTQLNLSVQPPRRENSAMTFDAADGYVLLFGGSYMNGTIATVYNDTWSFANGNWTQVHPAHAPFPRDSVSLTYSSEEGKVVLFGGAWFNRHFNDTWTYSNGSWTNITRSVGSPPQAREGGAMADDPADGELVLYGGLNDTPVGPSWAYYELDDTWLFVNGTWTQLCEPCAPSILAWAAIAYLPSNGSGTIVMSGGGLFSAGLPNLVRAEANTWYFPDTPLGGFLVGTPVSVDVGQSFALRAMLTGGAPPYSYSWTMGNGAVSDANPTSYAYPASGDFSIQLTAGDARGESIVLTAQATVATQLVASVASLPTSVDLGQSVSIRATLSGGLGNYSLAWSGLPPGACFASGSTAVLCIPNATGMYSVEAMVTDSNNDTETSAPTTINVYSDLRLGLLSANETSVTVGQTLRMSVSATGGRAPYAYEWNGLPVGCASVNSSQLTCEPSSPGIWVVTVTVIDSDNYYLTTSPLNITASPATAPPSVSASNGGWVWLVGIGSSAVLGSAILLSLRARRKDQDYARENDSPDSRAR